MSARRQFLRFLAPLLLSLLAVGGGRSMNALPVAADAGQIPPHGSACFKVNDFNGPAGISVDRAGQIYVADTFNDRIVRVNNTTGAGWTTLGTRGAGDTQFQSPRGIFVDAARRIYVVDSGNNRIVRMDTMTGAGWTTLGAQGAGDTQFQSPGGIFVDGAGRIYVADEGNHRIVRINDMAGAGWTTLSRPGDDINQFKDPTGLFVDGTGRIYVADSGNNRIVRVDDMTGAGWITLGRPGAGVMQFQTPRGISVDDAGGIYVADSGNNRVVRVDDMTGAGWITLGAWLTLGAQNPGISAVQFIEPHGIFVDAAGRIYVTEPGRVVRVDNMTGSGGTALGAPGIGAGVEVCTAPQAAVATIAPPCYTGYDGLGERAREIIVQWLRQNWPGAENAARWGLDYLEANCHAHDDTYLVTVATGYRNSSGLFALDLSNALRGAGPVAATQLNRGHPYVRGVVRDKSNVSHALVCAEDLDHAIVIRWCDLVSLSTIEVTELIYGQSSQGDSCLHEADANFARRWGEPVDESRAVSYQTGIVDANHDGYPAVTFQVHEIDCRTGKGRSYTEVFQPSLHGFVPSAGVAPASAFTQIDVPGAAGTSAQGISTSGAIVGSFFDSTGSPHAFVRAPAGAFTTIDVEGAKDSGAWGINDAGQIVGFFDDAGGKAHGFLRAPTGAFTTIDALGARRTSAWGISGLGQVAGIFEDASGAVHGFLRAPTGAFTIIDPPGATHASVLGISAAGAVVGWIEDAHGTHGFIRAPTGGFTLFDVPGAKGTSANGINNAGQIVGSFPDASGKVHGFLRTATGAFTTIDVPGATYTSAWGINDAGQIVGRFTDGAGRTHGFAMTR